MMAVVKKRGGWLFKGHTMHLWMKAVAKKFVDWSFKQGCLEFYDLFAEISHERPLVAPEHAVTSAQLKLRLLVRYTAKI